MSENKTDLYKAILKVMNEVKGIDKSMTVGSGSNAYKGVSDKDVKNIVGASMQKHGLILLPKSYHPKTTVERWEEDVTWNGKTSKKTKQSVFVEMSSMYELIHAETGQSKDIPAYGHGIDPQDKAAGKATTYALKNALLYMFLVPTGSIDDTDKEHSNDKPTPQAKPQPKPKAPAKPKKDFQEGGFEKALSSVFEGEIKAELIISKYNLTETQLKQLEEAEKTIKNK